MSDRISDLGTEDEKRILDTLRATPGMPSSAARTRAAAALGIGVAVAAKTTIAGAVTSAGAASLAKAAPIGIFSTLTAKVVGGTMIALAVSGIVVERSFSHHNASPADSSSAREARASRVPTGASAARAEDVPPAASSTNTDEPRPPAAVEFAPIANVVSAPKLEDAPVVATEAKRSDPSESRKQTEASRTTKPDDERALAGPAKNALAGEVPIADRPSREAQKPLDSATPPSKTEMPAAAPRDSGFERELLALQSAKKSVRAGDAKGALEILSGRFQFFEVEADVARIEALLSLGDRTRARELAKAVLQEHSDVPQAERLRALIRGSE